MILISFWFGFRRYCGKALKLLDDREKISDSSKTRKWQPVESH